MIRDRRAGMPPFTSGPQIDEHSGSEQSILPSGSLSTRSLQISSRRQLAEQLSPLTVLKSSHCSPQSISPLPHRVDNPRHSPVSHASETVQASPSSQARPSGLWMSVG